MKTYHVEWHIEVDAETPEQAALQARYQQTIPGTMALDFQVTEFDTEGDSVDVDLYDIEPRIDIDISAELLKALTDVMSFWVSSTEDDMPAELFDRANELIAKVKAL